MAGPGSRKMGGAGIKAGRPPTAMAGSGLGAPPRSPAAAMGAPPMAPKVANVRPPGIGAGAPGPLPGGAAPGLGAGPPPPPPGGMGGSGGFAKGGPTNLRAEAKREGEPLGLERKEAKAGFNMGGAVGGDTKSRHKGTIHKGR
jgi:hypothetical protein